MKKKKSGNGLKLIILGSAIGCIALLIGIFIIRLENKVPDEITTEYLQKKSVSKINSYKYAKLILDSEYTGNQDVPNVCEYILTSGKNTSYHTYSYRDAEQDIYQGWESHDGHYDLYIWDKTTEQWVYSHLEYEPVTSDTWSVVSDLSEYTILEESGNWGTDECWVLQMTGSSDVWEIVYEEIYIRKSDFLPMGILSYANSKQDKDRISDITPGEYEFGEITKGTTEVAEYEELISIYSLEFSNKPLDLFEKPTDYITEEDYNNLISAEESEEDVKTDN